MKISKYHTAKTDRCLEQLLQARQQQQQHKPVHRDQALDRQRAADRMHRTPGRVLPAVRSRHCSHSLVDSRVAWRGSLADHPNHQGNLHLTNISKHEQHWYKTRHGTSQLLQPLKATKLILFAVTASCCAISRTHCLDMTDMWQKVIKHSQNSISNNLCIEQNQKSNQLI